jgi:hypothetical protein
VSAEATGQTGAGGAPGELTEEELRAAYEAELGRITATDMMAQAAVSLLNIGARRLGIPGEGESEAGGSGGVRDLEQVRDSIDGARALLEILGRRIPQDLGPLRDALSRLQMAYAQEVAPAAGKAGAGAPQPREQPAPGAPEQPAGGEPRPGPAESSGRLWVPGR